MSTQDCFGCLNNPYRLDDRGSNSAPTFIPCGTYFRILERHNDGYEDLKVQTASHGTGWLKHISYSWREIKPRVACINSDAGGYNVQSSPDCGDILFYIPRGETFYVIDDPNPDHSNHRDVLIYARGQFGWLNSIRHFMTYKDTKDEKIYFTTKPYFDAIRDREEILVPPTKEESVHVKNHDIQLGPGEMCALNESVMPIEDKTWIPIKLFSEEPTGDISKVTQVTPKEEVNVAKTTDKQIEITTPTPEPKSIWETKAAEVQKEAVALVKDAVAADTVSEINVLKLNLLNRIKERAELISFTQSILEESSRAELTNPAARDIRGEIIPSAGPPVIVCKGFTSLEVILAFIAGALLVGLALFGGLLC